MILQTALQTVLNQQFQTQQYENARITRPNDEVPTNYMKTTCCDILPPLGDTLVCYCYTAPVGTACGVYRSYC